MNGDKKIIYTHSATERLQMFHHEVDAELQRYFQERKFVPGDEFIEVTASDIDEVAQKFRISRPIRTSSVRNLIPIVYSVIGVIMAVIGIFYEQFKVILEGDPKRLIFIGGGLFMLLISSYYLYMLKRKAQLERDIREIEFRKKYRDDNYTNFS